MSDRHSLLGVLYAEDFDAVEDAEPAAAPEPEMIVPSFSAAELDAARRAGQEAGRQEAERGLLAARLQLLTLVAKGLADAKGEAAQVAEAAAEGVARLMLSSLMSCLPVFCRRHGGAELRALVRHLLPSLVDEPRVTIRINPHMVAMLREEVAALDQELADAFVLVPTDAIPPGDARITWQDGAAIRDTARVRATIADALAALGLYHEETADA